MQNTNLLKKDLMIGIYGNQRLILKQLFRGRFLVDSMIAEISDWQVKYAIILMRSKSFG
jgi:hypothetical protein